MKKEIAIHCKYDHLEVIKELKDHPKNVNRHGQDQIDRLADMYKYHGIRHPIIISKLSGYIVAGHGRKLAAIRAGLKTFPVVFQEFENIEAEYAFLVSDNAISDWSELDMKAINKSLEDLGPDFDLDMLGLKDFTLDFEDKFNENEENIYTRKIESPIYTPKGEKPKTRDLFDLTKYYELIKKIEKADLNEEIKEFLRFAACRHIKFNYKNIAEFYCHLDKKEQELFEDSALIIIDFNKAIENGFVQLTEEIRKLYEQEN